MANNRIFYIADCHFFDNLTFKWDLRNDEDVERFADVDAKNEAMIERWNAKITNRDHVYILGDVFNCSCENAQIILKRLNGAKHFIIGNHDRAWIKNIAKTKKYSILECCDYKELTDNGRKVILSHYPIMFWDKQHEGAFHIYGHVHNSKEEHIFQEFGKALVEKGQLIEFRGVNAGSMLHQYEPVTLDELCEFYNIGNFTKEDFRNARNKEVKEMKQREKAFNNTND